MTLFIPAVALLIATPGAASADIAGSAWGQCSDGTPRMQGQLVDGRRHGPWRTMQVVIERGRARCVCPQDAGRYESGVEVGEWTLYTRFVDDDVAAMRANLCRQYGICEAPGCSPARVLFTYDPTTQIQESRYADGALRSRGAFRDGRREGGHTSWFPSGRVQRRGRYLGGVAVGVWEVGGDDDRPRQHVSLDPAAPAVTTQPRATTVRTARVQAADRAP